jgi:putative aldouronate transport system permease protein
MDAVSLAKPRKRTVFQKMWQQKFLFLMSVPFIIWCIIFCYMPIIGPTGWIMSFQEYSPGADSQPWVGLKQFKELFQDPTFYDSLKNTLALSALSIVVGTIAAILFALFLNEIRGMAFKRTVQTISYLPHFVSWVIAASIITKILSTDGGAVNDMLVALHIIKAPILFLAKPNYFWGICTGTNIWKEVGWDAIIYLAAIAGIDPTLYEAASVDGAGRFKKMWHVTLSSIRPTIIILLVIKIGGLVNYGFEQPLLLSNNLTSAKANVLTLYALDYGINMSKFSYGTAIGIFQSVVSIILVFSANRAAKKFGEGQLM